jgi:ABC-type glycerol-3-phosphate transport system substrate-binding protein
MADTKISALPASTTPLAGTEVLPIVQGGSTVKVSVANLTAGRAISATAVTASTGNFIVGTAGQGVDFSVNPAAPGVVSELLDDYEEGTWTPILTTTGTDFTSVTYAAQTGEYVKIGQAIYYYFQITTSAVTIGAATGDVGVGGLPFGTGGGETTSYLSASGWVLNIPSSAEKRGGAQTFARLKYRATANGATVNMAVTDVSTGTNEILGCLYIVRSV